jgi:hypothetical protein
MFCDEHGTLDYCPKCIESMEDKRVDELEAQVAALEAAMAEALSNMEYYPASLGEMWLVQDSDITAMQALIQEKGDS